MGYSQVPRIQLNNDGTISLEVNVSGFEEGTPVEISGQATQENGAVAAFSSVLKMPEHKDDEACRYAGLRTGFCAEEIRGGISHHGSCASSGNLDHHAGGGRGSRDLPASRGFRGFRRAQGYMESESL